MDEIKAMIDGKEYTPDQFRRDAVRMLDHYRTKCSDYMGKMDCKNVPCNDCPLNNNGCSTTKIQTFETIKTVYNWAQDHPITTNRDKLKETFGDDVFNYIGSRLFHEDWLEEEYKKPRKKENKNDD